MIRQSLDSNRAVGGLRGEKKPELVELMKLSRARKTMPESPDERSTCRGLFEADVKHRLSRTEEGSNVIKNLASLPH